MLPSFPTACKEGVSLKEAIKVSVITVSVPPATRVLWGEVVVVVKGEEWLELVVVAEGIACCAVCVIVEVNLQTVGEVLRAHGEGLVLLHQRNGIALYTLST